MINRVTLIGNLGRDPEVRTTGSGTNVANLSVATTRRVKDRDGNWSDETEWHKVTVWGKTAENCARFLKKGRQVYIEGRLQTRKWQDNDGKDRYSTEVVAEVIKFLGGKEGGGGGQSSGGYGGGYGGRSGGGYGGGQGGGEIPFAP